MATQLPARRRNLSHLRQGATAVEFALVAPVFFLIMLGSFELSRLNVLRHSADNAAYEAARHAMVPGATAAEAVAKANSLLRIVGARGANVTITPAVLGPDDDTINVRVDIPLNQNGWVVPHFTAGRTLTAQSTLSTERIAP
jgi:Flp pilus assembly protein TadG